MPGLVRLGWRGLKKKLIDRPDIKFALMLARTLGRTLGELESTCTAEEFGLWMALYESDPWGPVREDLAAGMICSTMANIKRREETPAFSPLDFAPFLKPAEPAQEATIEEFFNLVGAINEHS